MPDPSITRIQPGSSKFDPYEPAYYKRGAKLIAELRPRRGNGEDRPDAFKLIPLNPDIPSRVYRSLREAEQWIEKLT